MDFTHSQGTRHFELHLEENYTEPGSLPLLSIAYYAQKVRTKAGLELQALASFSKTRKSRSTLVRQEPLNIGQKKTRPRSLTREKTDRLF